MTTENAAVSIGSKIASPPRWFSPAEIVVPLALASVTLLPVGFLLFNSLNTASPGQEAVFGLKNWITAYSQPGTLGVIWTTFALGAARVTIALFFGALFAWLIARSDMPGGSVIEFCFWIEFFIPTLPITLGWLLLLDPNYGLINTLARDLGLVQQSLFNLMSFWGIVWIHLTASTMPVAVILLTPAFRRVGAALEEAARVCGANPWRMVTRITVPLLAPAILPTAVIMLVRSLEAFEVELLVGRPAGIFVYSTKIYDLISEDPHDYGQATALGALFLVVLFVLAVCYRRRIAGRQFTTITGTGYSTARFKLGRWRYVALGFCILWLIVGLLLPVTFLILGSVMRRFGFFGVQDPYTLNHWSHVLSDPLLSSSLVNSLVIGISAALIGVILFSLIAYVIVRSQLRTRALVDFLAWIPWAVPGILEGLALLWLFLATPLKTVLYGGLMGIALAMVIKEIPIGTQLFKSGLYQIGRDLEEAARVCGATWKNMYVRVLLPLIAPMAVNVALVIFISSIRDISTAVLLYSANSRPISILMLEYSYSGDLERGAVLGVLLSILVAVAALVARNLAYRFGTIR